MINLENKRKYDIEDSEMHKLALNILHTYNLVFSKYHDALKRFKLNFEQYLILKFLKKSYPNVLLMTELKQLVLNKNLNLSRSVDTLFKRGLILREQTTDDRRMVELILTTKGVEFLDTIEVSLKKIENIKREKEISDIISLNSLLFKFRTTQN